MMGLMFKLFDGLREIMNSSTKHKGFKTIKFCEMKMNEMFEGENRNPFFEAIYMAQYSYYAMLAEIGTREERLKVSEKIVPILECALAVELKCYGKYHKQTYETYAGLAEHTYRLN
jgi:hypothetical protein